MTYCKIRVQTKAGEKQDGEADTESRDTNSSGTRKVAMKAGEDGNGLGEASG